MEKDWLRDIYMKIRHINDQAVKSFVAVTDGYEATGVQFGVLRNIPVKESITMTELTGRVHCVASNMTTIIRRMEKQGLVETGKNASDKRQTMVALTEKGRATRQIMEEGYQKFLTEAFGVLDERERKELDWLLGKIERNLM